MYYTFTNYKRILVKKYYTMLILSLCYTFQTQAQLSTKKFNLDISHLNATNFCPNQTLSFKVTTRIYAGDPALSCPSLKLYLQNLRYQVNIGTLDTLDFSNIKDNGNIATISSRNGGIFTVNIVDAVDADNDRLGTNSGANLATLDFCGDGEHVVSTCSSSVVAGPTLPSVCPKTYPITDISFNVTYTIPNTAALGTYLITAKETLDIYQDYMPTTLLQANFMVTYPEVSYQPNRSFTIQSCATICKAGYTAPCLVNSLFCADSITKTFNLTTIALTCSKPDSTIVTWHTSNPATLANMVANPYSVPKGFYWAAYKDTTNNCFGNNGFATQQVTVDTCKNYVTSGGSGGIESKTLGSIIAQRLYERATNNLPQETTTPTTSFTKASHSLTINGASDLKLGDLIPTSVLGTNKAFVSTPTDLLNFTNATEVLSVDYALNNQVKAVVFATQTFGEVYNHTKPICDRLKGASLLEVKQLTINGINLISYKVQQCTGEVEFAINLSAGVKAGRNSISLQSNWFTNNYQTDEKLLNFQVWAVSYEMAANLAKDIINNLQKQGTIQAINANDIPQLYVYKGERKGTKLLLHIANQTTITNAVIELKEKATETSIEITRQVPVNITGLGNSTIEIDVQDNYEATLNLFVNGKKVDMLYLNDGTWALDYNKSNTTIQQFNVTKTSNYIATNNEYDLMRNVQFTASTKDYVTVYKNIGTQCKALPLANYNSLKLIANATGASSITVTLISSSIINWNEQYQFTINNIEGKKEYAINLNDFKSNKNNQGLKANSITGISFAYNPAKNVNQTMVGEISKARFSEESVPTLTVQNKTLNIYPNPIQSKQFTAFFTSESDQSVAIRIVEVTTGKTIKTQFLQAKKGNNQVNVQLHTIIAKGYYTISLQADNGKYETKKLLIN